jgi:hypothetical protein
MAVRIEHLICQGDGGNRQRSKPNRAEPSCGWLGARNGRERCDRCPCREVRGQLDACGHQGSIAHERDLEQGFIQGHVKHEEWKRVGLVSVTTGCLERLEHHKSKSMLALSSRFKLLSQMLKVTSQGSNVFLSRIVSRLRRANLVLQILVGLDRSRLDVLDHQDPNNSKGIIRLKIITDTFLQFRSETSQDELDGSFVVAFIILVKHLHARLRSLASTRNGAASMIFDDTSHVIALFRIVEIGNGV